MSKIDLHLKYKSETGLNREDPDTIDGLNDNQIEYIKWLEDIAQSVIDINPKFIDDLRNQPRSLIVDK